MMPDRARCGVTRHAERVTRSPNDKDDMADLRPERAQKCETTLGQEAPLVKRDYRTLLAPSAGVVPRNENEAGGGEPPSASQVSRGGARDRSSCRSTARTRAQSGAGATA